MKGISGFMVLLIVGAVVVLGSQGGLFSSFPAGGLTITSIDPVDISVNGAEPTGYFRVTAVVDRGSETIIGSPIPPSEFKEETGYTTKNSMSIKLSEFKETARYAVDNANPNTRFYLTYAFNTNQGCSWIIPLTFKSMCVTRQEKLIDAPLSSFSPTIRSDVNVSVVVGTKTETVHISSDQPANDFSFGNVKWTGNLVTGNIVPASQSFRALYDKSRSNWAIIKTDNTQYTQFKNQETRIVGYLDNVKLNAFGNDENAIVAEINTYNNYYNSLTAQDDGISMFKWETSKSDSTKGVFNYQVPINTMIPQLVFNIKASYIGILVSVGQPSIGTITSKCFASGDGQGTVYVPTTNTGQGAGSFSYSLEGCTQFSPVVSVTGEQFAIGQTRTIPYPVKTAGSASAVNQTCTIKVCDSSGFGTCVSKPVNICMGEARFCTEGVLTREGNCIMQCINNVKSVKQCCGLNQELTTDMTCKTISGVDTSGGGSGGTGSCQPIFGVIPDIPCIIGEWFATYGLAVIIILVLVLVIGLFILVR